MASGGRSLGCSKVVSTYIQLTIRDVQRIRSLHSPCTSLSHHRISVVCANGLHGCSAAEM